MSAEAVITARPSRRRPWTTAQTLAWILFRTERAIDVAGAARAPKSNTGPTAGSILALVNIVLDAPYRRKVGEGSTVSDISIAESELQSAVAAGALLPDGEDRFDRQAVRALWPGKGRGNAFKPALDARQVDRVALAIRQTSRSEAKAQGAVSNRGPREMLLSSIGLTIENREDRRNLFRAAIRVAARRLGLRWGRRRGLKSEALVKLGAAERRRQAGSLRSWQTRKAADPRQLRDT
jgi:hypothetical protein